MDNERTSRPAPVSQPPRLALRPREAAKALGIGERLLWSMTNQGLIPHLRLGKAIVYPVAELERWLAERAAKGGRR
ncbi:MAG TPA: helix-turn-helix domain-containing protein [Phycisphaerae bacterium]|nr:helix-turn-helix domain-containing protein [Phycisphaerae bacterium]